MIEYDNKNKVMDITCEVCDNTDTFYGTWQECFDEAKQNGWSAHKDGDLWKHCCGQVCRDSFYAERRQR